MQARMRAAKFNACPMPRKHDFDAMGAIARLDPHVLLGNRDGFAVMAPFEAPPERPAKDGHFEPYEGQHGPETLERHEPCDAKSRRTQRAEKEECPARLERAVRDDLDSLQATGHAGK